MQPEGWASAAIVADSSTAIVPAGSDRVAAIDLATGQQLWRFPDAARFPDQAKLKLRAVYGQAIIDAGTVYFADYDSQVFALNLSDGSLRWKLDTGISGKIISGLSAQGDLLAFGTGDGYLYQIRKADGTPAPGWDRAGRNLGSAIWAAPVYGGDVIYVATMGGEVRALRSADGSDAWSQPFGISAAIAELTPLGASRLFVPTLDGRVFLLDTATGTPVGNPFKASNWVWSRPAFRDNTVYFGDFQGMVYALDITAAGFQRRWEQKVSGRVKSGPLLIGNELIVATRDSLVYFLAAADGKQDNNVPVLNSGTIRANVTEYRGSGLIVTTKGGLFLADPQRFTVAPVGTGGPR